MKKFKGAPAIAGLFLLGLLLAQGCGGGGQSLESVVAPTNESADANGDAPRFVNVRPEDMADHTDEEIGPYDSNPVTEFYGGADIAGSGAGFLDPSICGSCHEDVYNSFVETNHNKAWDKKVGAGYSGFDGTDKYCVMCHTVSGPFLDLDNDHEFDPADGEIGAFGLSPSTTAGEFGISPDTFSNTDEVPEEFQGIQCENCHGPGSLHGGDKDFIVAGEQAFSPTTCNYCHGQYEEWVKSGHSIAKERTSTSCSPCHTGDAFVAFTESSDTSDIVDFAYNYNTMNETNGAVHQVGCAACHDPHDIDGGEYQLRLPKEELCITCHEGRKKLPGDSHAPHHNMQGRVLNGQGIMTPDNKMLWDSEKLICKNAEYSASSDPTATCGEGVNYRLTVKTTIDAPMGNATCADCHMYSYSDRAAGIIWLGHTFKPQTEACETCHPSMDAADVIGQRQHDFEVQYAILEARLEAAAANSAGFTDAQQTLYDNAAWNLAYIEYDGSEGMHNGNLINTAIEYTDEILSKLGY